MTSELFETLGQLSVYPLEYAQSAYGWGKGDLEGFQLDDWQAGFLREWGEEIRIRGFNGSAPVEPIRGSVVSGRGVGKTALEAIIVDFITSTRPRCKGIVTANTGPQLNTKLWPEIVKWKRRGFTANWFDVTSGRGSMKLAHKLFKEEWRVDGYNWEASEPDSFTGQHAATSTQFYIFDEASGVPKSIIDAADAGMTDGEPMLFMFGNGNKNSGALFESQNVKAHRFHIRKKVDSRESRLTNKEQIARDIAEYGIDSDYVKVNILGDFPRQSVKQFISADIVDRAMGMSLDPSPYDPIVIGVDCAAYGGDRSVIFVRQGRDAQREPEIYQGLDTMQLAARVAHLSRELLPDAVFVDAGGIGTPIIDRIEALNVSVTPVNFGGRSPDSTCHNMATYMWKQARDWLREGGALWNGLDLRTELTVREYSFDNSNRFVIEPKDVLRKRGERSPDIADAFVLTFAAPVGPRNWKRTEAQMRGERESGTVGADFDPYARW